MSGVVNVGGGECRGGECRTITFLTYSRVYVFKIYLKTKIVFDLIEKKLKKKLKKMRKS